MDPEATRSSLEALHSDSFGWALACSNRDADAAREVLQMAYVKVLDASARWSGEGSFKTWLFGVIRTTAAEKRRSELLRGVRLERWWNRRGAAAPVVDPEASAASGEAARRIGETLGRLSSRQREVLHLVFYQEMTLDEAARVLGVAPGTARLHYERGKQRLRALLPPGIRP